MANSPSISTSGSVTAVGIADTLISIERIRFIDGTLAYDPATTEAQAARLYQAALGRVPDAGGLAYWSQQLAGGATLTQLANQFISSSEYQTRFGSPDNSGLVTLLYQNVLGRAPDAGGLAYWTGQLATGALTQAQLLVSFSESAENRANTASQVSSGLWAADEQAASVARLYYTTFGRAPDAAGLTYWTGQLEGAAMSLNQLAAQFITSAEFTGKYGNLSGQGLVDQLYLNVLGRSADAGGESYWTGQLTSGALSRPGLVLAFSESTEHQSQLYNVIEAHGIVCT